MADLQGEVVVTTSDLNVTMHAGDTKTLPFTIALPDGGDLNGSALRWQCARKHSGGFAAPAVSKAIGSGITVTDADAGTLEVRLDPADTAGLSGRYYHELEVVDVVATSRRWRPGSSPSAGTWSRPDTPEKIGQNCTISIEEAAEVTRPM